MTTRQERKINQFYWGPIDRLIHLETLCGCIAVNIFGGSREPLELEEDDETGLTFADPNATYDVYAARCNRCVASPIFETREDATWWARQHQKGER